MFDKTLEENLLLKKQNSRLKVTEDRKEKILAFIKEHPTATFQEIGDHLGISKQLAHNFMKVNEKDFKAFLNKNKKERQKSKNEKQALIESSTKKAYEKIISPDTLLLALKIKTLLENGKKRADIIEVLNISKPRFASIIQRYKDVVLDKIGLYNETVLKAKKLSQEKKQDYIIGRACGVDKKTIEHWRETGFKTLPTQVNVTDLINQIHNK